MEAYPCLWLVDQTFVSVLELSDLRNYQLHYLQHRFHKHCRLPVLGALLSLSPCLSEFCLPTPFHPAQRLWVSIFPLFSSAYPLHNHMLQCLHPPVSQPQEHVCTDFSAWMLLSSQKCYPCKDATSGLAVHPLHLFSNISKYVLLGPIYAKENEDLYWMAAQQACVLKISTLAYQFLPFLKNFNFIHNPAPLPVFLWMILPHKIGFFLYWSPLLCTALIPI